MMLKKSILVGLGVAFGLLTTGLVSQASSYTVQQGDTVSEIAQTYGTSINAIANENQLSDPNIIYVGEELTIGEKETQQSTQTAQQPVEQSQQPVQQPQQNQSQEVSQNNSQNYSGSSDVSSVAQEMQSRTGVSASEWETIIKRESGGNPAAQNPSSLAHGLFQQLGETSNNVQTQINDAVSLYHKQGLDAWSETR